VLKFMKTGAILFWTDLLAAVSFLSLAGTGVLLKWVLPHGRGSGRHEWLGLSRHDWGDVHFWISIALTALVAVHLLSHLGWIVSATPRYLLGRRKRAVPLEA
jgi:hypothetical protein